MQFVDLKHYLHKEVSVPLRGRGFESAKLPGTAHPIGKFPSPYGEEVLKVPVGQLRDNAGRIVGFPSPYGEEVLKGD